METTQQMDLFGEVDPQAVPIEESARLAGVSSATIRNWIKTGYLTPSCRGKVTLESLERFCDEIAGKEKLNGRANKSRKDIHDYDATLLSFLDRIKKADDSLDLLGAKYEASLSESYRNKEGVYYTPTNVVDDLLQAPSGAINEATFCDPCCGSGNFVIRALSLGFKPENIHGFDVDPVGVELTRKRIYQKTGFESPNIRNIDFLDLAISRQSPVFNYIFTNPPWGKKLDKKSKEEFGRLFNSGSSIDTCSLFFFACLRCTDEDGELGLLLPEAFFNISTYTSARVRALDYEIKRLIDYGKPFKGLLTKAHGIVLSKKRLGKRDTVKCSTSGRTCDRSLRSFKNNPKFILNISCSDKDEKIISHILSIPHLTLKNQAKWGLGIVTGNNRKFIIENEEPDYLPVYRGSDIAPHGLKDPCCFIPSDLSCYQQVAPLELFQANEKLIYKFISSSLCFFNDTKKRFILNSANMLVLNKDFPISGDQLCNLLNSEIMNFIFRKVFDTHKVLRGDLEELPIHTDYFNLNPVFVEEVYLDFLGLYRLANGTYRLKE